MAFCEKVGLLRCGEVLNVVEYGIGYVEDAATLDGSFTSDGQTVGLQRTADGKVRATVTPEGLPPAFFLCVEVKKWQDKGRMTQGTT